MIRASTAAKSKKKKPLNSVSAEDDVRLAVQNLKRERIVAAAVTQFEEHGFTQASLDAVAEQMGVTKPFIYTQFRSKSELLGEICSRAMRIALQAIDEALARYNTPREQLEQFARLMMLGIVRSGKHLAIYMREEKNLSPEDFQLIRKLRGEVDKKLVDVLKRGVEEGVFEIADPRLAALAIGGIATWVGVRLGQSTRYSSEQVAEGIVPLILSMSGARR
jgi:AcrR family transcriptional regulator